MRLSTEPIPTGVALAMPLPPCNWCGDTAAVAVGSYVLCVGCWEFIQLHRGDGEDE